MRKEGWQLRNRKFLNHRPRKKQDFLKCRLGALESLQYHARTYSYEQWNWMSSFFPDRIILGYGNPPCFLSGGPHTPITYLQYHKPGRKPILLREGLRLNLKGELRNEAYKIPLLFYWLNQQSA